jgi:hypothetical protein
MRYIHEYISESGFVVIQEYDNGRQREVSPQRPAYLAWISGGNVPEEIEYIPPTLSQVRNGKLYELNAAFAEFCVVTEAERAAVDNNRYKNDFKQARNNGREYYLTQKQAINAAADIAAVNAITVDLNPYIITNITLADIMAEA